MKYNKILINLIFAIGIICGPATAEDPNRGAAKTHRKGRTIIYVQPVIIYNIISGSSISIGNGYDNYDNTVNAPAEKRRDKYVPAAVLIGDYEEIFNYAMENATDSNTAEILPELFNSHAARIIYEASFTEQFFEKITQDNPNDTKERYKLIQVARKIAGENYWHYLTDFKEAKTKDNQINNKLRQALKRGIVQKLQSDKKIFGKSNFNTSGDWLSRMLACAAVNPQTGSVLNPALIYGEEWELQQDPINDEAVRVLNEMAGIYKKTDANETEPNNVTPP
ncbi:MAG: hypothetical protein ABSE89_06055 [Sedimentisphaerales bacterium]